MAARLTKRSDTLYDIIVPGMSATGFSADRVVASEDGSTLTLTRGAKHVVLKVNGRSVDLVQGGVRTPYISSVGDNITVHGAFPPV